MSETLGVLCAKCLGRAYLNIRGDAGDRGFRDAVERLLGVALPVQPCTWNHVDRSALYWLGPDEWLLAAGDGAAKDLERRIRDSLDHRFSVADVTGAQVQVELSGPAAGRVLQKSSPYDFHPRNFPAGRCVQTVFAKTTALVAAKDGDAFDIVFRRSYADYLMRWLADAAAEYGYRVDGEELRDSAGRVGNCP